MAAIMAVCASVSGYVDSRGTAGISGSTVALRVALIVLIGICVLGSFQLIEFLAKDHPSLLSSPSEWSEKVHPEW